MVCIVRAEALVEALPGWPRHDPFGVGATQPMAYDPPEPGAPPPDAEIRRKMDTERSMRMQAEDVVKAETM